MPSTPPSSEPVSEIAPAPPARSGGAEPTMMSAVRMKVGPRPIDMTTWAATSSGRPPARIWVIIRKASASRPMPTATT